MKYWDRKLIREQLDQKLVNYKNLPPVAQETGWIKLIREALGMSARQLGKKVGIDQSRISRLEAAETEGDLKLSSLKKIAEGLNMKFVYAFVPEESLEQTVQQQAEKIALKRLNRVSHSMMLEDQELSYSDKQSALETLKQKIMINEPKDFWDQ